MVNKLVPAWFCSTIADGLQRLVALALPGQPPAETIALTGQVWIETLWPSRAWLENLDKPRFATAFRLLSLDIDRWPAPKLLLARMPPRSEPLKLEGPHLDGKQLAKSRKRLQALRVQLRGQVRPGASLPTRAEAIRSQKELAHRILEMEAGS